MKPVPSVSGGGVEGQVEEKASKDLNPKFRPIRGNSSALRENLRERSRGEGGGGKTGKKKEEKSVVYHKEQGEGKMRKKI